VLIAPIYILINSFNGLRSLYNIHLMSTYVLLHMYWLQRDLYTLCIYSNYTYISYSWYLPFLSGIFCSGCFVWLVGYFQKNIKTYSIYFTITNMSFNSATIIYLPFIRTTHIIIWLSYVVRTSWLCDTQYTHTHVSIMV